MHVAIPFFNRAAQYWLDQPPSSLAWSLAALVVSLAGLLWTWFRTTLNDKKGGSPIGRPACPPELLKDDLKGGVANAYAFEREITVPFDIGDTRVSKILVHPIKVCEQTVVLSSVYSLTSCDVQSCRGTSVTESRYSPEGLEVCPCPSPLPPSHSLRTGALRMCVCPLGPLVMIYGLASALSSSSLVPRIPKGHIHKKI